MHYLISDPGEHYWSMKINEVLSKRKGKKCVGQCKNTCMGHIRPTGCQFAIFAITFVISSCDTDERARVLLLVCKSWFLPLLLVMSLGLMTRAGEMILGTYTVSIFLLVSSTRLWAPGRVGYHALYPWLQHSLSHFPTSFSPQHFLCHKTYFAYLSCLLFSPLEYKFHEVRNLFYSLLYPHNLELCLAHSPIHWLSKLIPLFIVLSTVSGTEQVLKNINWTEKHCPDKKNGVKLG